METESNSSILENATPPHTPKFDNPNPFSNMTSTASKENLSTSDKFLASLQQSAASPIPLGNVNMASPVAESTHSLNVNNPTSKQLNYFSPTLETPVKNLVTSDKPNDNTSALSQSAMPIVPQLLPFRNEVSTDKLKA